MIRRSPVPILLAALILAGCAASEPAPVERRGAAAPIESRAPAARAPSSGPATSTPPTATASAGEIVVPAGATLYQIAEEQRVNLRALIVANDLSAPYALTAGRRLVLPQTNAYVVQRGDTLYSIAQRFSVQPRSLALLNGLREPYTIQPGQSLVLPGPGGAASTASTGAPTRAPLFNIFSGPRPQFAWPIEGEVVGRFGPTPGGGRNDGINIAARAGQDVHAAADGVVVFADVLEGYGQLVLIRHVDGWISAYAHNSRLLVAEEQTVSQGDAIAEAGASGAVGAPQLHFELRRNGSPVDPLTALPARRG